jgi:hypothetical protein
MFLIASFGSLMIFACILMVVNPERFSAGIVRVSEKKWFHILSRSIAGAIFITYSSDTHYPSVFRILGYGLIVVAIGLVILAPQRQKKFALSQRTILRINLDP